MVQYSTLGKLFILLIISSFNQFHGTGLLQHLTLSIDHLKQYHNEDECLNHLQAAIDKIDFRDEDHIVENLTSAMHDDDVLKVKK